MTEKAAENGFSSRPRVLRSSEGVGGSELERTVGQREGEERMKDDQGEPVVEPGVRGEASPEQQQRENSQ